MFVKAIVFVVGTSKVQQIVEAFSQAIESGEWAPGSKLPSVRELTQVLGVSKFTLNEALDRLRGRNLLTSSQGRGYFVAATNTQLSNRAPAGLTSSVIVSTWPSASLRHVRSLDPQHGVQGQLLAFMLQAVVEVQRTDAPPPGLR